MPASRGRRRPARGRPASNARMNSRPMVLRLVSGSVTPASASRNRSRRVHGVQLRPGGGHEVLLHLLGLARPQQAVVDEHAGQLVADRPLDQRGRDRRVDAAGQPADHPPVADLLTDRRDLLVDDVGDRPARGDARRRRTGSGAAPAGRAAECPTSGWYCTPASRRSRSSNAATGAPVPTPPSPRSPRGPARPSRRGSSTPGAGVGRPACSVPASSVTVSSVRPYSRVPVRRDLPAERLRHRLEAVAESQHRHPGGEQLGVELRGAGRVHARRARRTGSAPRACGRGARRRRGRRARSRSRPAPPAPGGR